MNDYVQLNAFIPNFVSRNPFVAGKRQSFKPVLYNDVLSFECHLV